jgi:proliferating cell nuclear antigen
VGIEASKDGIRFSCQGDIGSGSVTVRQHSNVEKPENDVTINLSEPVSLTFSLKYLVNFCKASGLSSKVKLCLSQEVPLLVEYQLTGTGYLRFYLAPKVWLLYMLRIASCTDSYFLRRSEMTSDVASRLTFRISSIS